ncbi:MAG: glycosyltransferase family 4 protein [Deltaproteobacteria bacterium]|nr:glycosyltransferase family 4 protein [Deltaproteobacteria bacterium]
MNKINQVEHKVAILGSMPPLRGLSSYCFELSRAISNFCTIEFLSFKKLYPSFLYPGRDLKDDKTFPVVLYDRLTVKRKLTWYNPITWLIAGLLTKADILHAQWWSLPLFPVYVFICLGFKLRKKPIVFTVHNVLPHEKPTLYLTLTRFLFKLSDHFIVHTTNNVEQLSQYYSISKNRISCIAHGTLDFHIKKHPSKNNIKSEMGFDANHKIILFFGAIRPYKGLLISFSKVLKTIPDARLLIAGKLWEKWHPYDTLIKSLEITDYVTTFPDYIPSGEVHKFFDSSDLVVLPYHRFDSQSGVGTTSIAFRKPLIVTRVGGLPDLVTDSRCVVPPKDTQALTKAITVCLGNPDHMKSMSLSADEIAKDLSWPAIAKKTCEVYDQLIQFSANLKTS